MAAVMKWASKRGKGWMGSGLGRCRGTVEHAPASPYMIAVIGAAQRPAEIAGSVRPPVAPSRPLALWLFAACLLLAVLVVVGGATRLTHSGLSIPEWKPVTGTLPPFGAAAWQAQFDRYRATPEYRLANPGMTLDGFRTIFWWEYTHRLLARLFGLVLLLPLVVLVVRRRIAPRLAAQLAGIVALVGVQGALGWFMVASGLVDDPRVSALRLTAHLGLATLILALLFRLALGQWTRTGSGPAPTARGRRLRAAARGLVALVFVQLLSGGLVAGSRAGVLFQIFPRMGESFVPAGLWTLTPAPLNLLHNLVTIQFTHRLLAWTLVLAGGLFVLAVRRGPSPRRLCRVATLLAAALALQFGLGVATLLAGVTVGLGVAHQAGALLVLAAAIATAHAAGRSEETAALAVQGGGAVGGALEGSHVAEQEALGMRFEQTGLMPATEHPDGGLERRAGEVGELLAGQADGDPHLAALRLADLARQAQEEQGEARLDPVARQLDDAVAAFDVMTGQGGKQQPEQ